MEPLVARAFLNRLLNAAEKKDLRDYEKKLPLGRFLTGSEICQRFNLKGDPLPQADTDKMDILLWKWRHRDEAKFFALPTGANLYKDNFAYMDNWLEFADANYRENLFPA